MYVVIYQSHGWYGDLESCFHHPIFLFRNLQATLLSSMDGDPQEGNKTSFGCLKGLMLDAFFGENMYIAIWEDVKLKQQDVSCDTTNVLSQNDIKICLEFILFLFMLHSQIV